MIRRALLVLLAICLGCSAQAPPTSPAQPAGTALPSDLTKALERHVRAHYSLPADVNLILGPLHASEFPNYDEMSIVFDSGEKKQTYAFLLSHDHKTLIRMTKIDLSTDPYAEIMKKIDVAGRPTRGKKDAKVVVVNYDDFQCPFCSRLHATLFPEIFKEYGDRVLFVYKDYPIEDLHPWSLHAAVNANCLGAQSGEAYWDYADYLHANQRAINALKEHGAQNSELDKLASLNGQSHKLDDSKLQACLKAQDEKAVRASIKEGDGLGVNATPALFVSGEKLEGAVPASEVRAALDRALKDAGIAVPEHKAAAADSRTPSVTPSK